MADQASLRAAADAAIASFGKGVQQIRRRGIAARAAMQAATATVTSPDGAVTATVGADGSLSAVTFGPAADSRSRESLATVVVETTRAAHAAALADAQQRVAEIEGVDSEPAEVLARDRAAVLGPPPGDGFAGRGL